MQITAVKAILKKKNKSLTSSVTPIFYYLIVISMIIQLFIIIQLVASKAHDVGIPLLQSI